MDDADTQALPSGKSALPHRVGQAQGRQLLMRKTLRLGIALLFGLLVFAAPHLRGLERELALTARIAILIGVTATLLVCALRDEAWIAEQADRHAPKLIALLLLTVVAVGYYLFVYFRPGIPTPEMVAPAIAAFATFSASASAGLTALGYLLSERLLPRSR